MPRYDFECILPCRKDKEPEEVTMAVEDYDRLRAILKCKKCGKALKRVISPKPEGLALARLDALIATVKEACPTRYRPWSLY